MKVFSSSETMVLLLSLRLLLSDAILLPVSPTTVGLRHSDTVVTHRLVARSLSIADKKSRHSDDDYSYTFDDDSSKTTTDKKPATATKKAPTRTKSNTDSGMNTTDDEQGPSGSQEDVSEWDERHNETSATDMLYNVTTSKNATSYALLPSEAAQTESWAVAILAIFSGLAVVLFAATALKRCSQRRSQRQGYREIENLVV